MPKYIKLEPHLKQEEIDQRYRQAQDVHERSRWQAIRLIGQGKRAKDVAEVMGYSPNWVRDTVKRYNAGGPESMRDGRRENPGRERLLSAEQEQTLLAEMTGAQEKGEAWNGPQVAQRMSEMLGRPVYTQRGWEQLKRWKMSAKVPRPAHVKADKQAQDMFKKRP